MKNKLHQLWVKGDPRQDAIQLFAGRADAFAIVRQILEQLEDEDEEGRVIRIKLFGTLATTEEPE